MKNSIVYYSNIFKSLKSNGPKTRFVLLIGEEDYLKKVAILRIEEFLKTKRIVFFGKESQISDISPILSSTGLFSTKRLFVIYEFEKLKERDSIFQLQVPEGTYIALVISSSYEKRKLKNLLNKYRKLKELTIFEFSPLDTKGFIKWVKSRLKKNNIETDERTLKILINKLPTDLNRADIELKKLFLYMDEDRFLDEHHLKILTHDTDYTIQKELIDIMGYEKLNLKKIYNSIENRRTNEIIYELETHFARIIDARLNTNFSDKYHADWRIKPYKKHKMLHTLKDASIIMERLLGIEYAAKTTLRNEKIIKQLILLSLLP